MKAKFQWLIVVAAAALFCLAGWTGRAQVQGTHSGARVTWEYKTIQGSRALRDDQLNDMGAQGWELVTFDDGERGNGSYPGTYYFKRAK
jgi:hypothetical protein